MENQALKNHMPIKDRSFEFAVGIVKLCSQLREVKEFELSNQLIRSGTSVGANIREAFNAYSNKDYLYKLSIAQKEVAETIYWLEIINAHLGGESKTRNSLSSESQQLLKIIRTMILNNKKKQLTTLNDEL